MGNALHEAVLQACRNFMIPIARFLLRNGVTFKEFAEISKWAFVHVASEDYGTRGRKASVSRIAAVTGVSRKEVSRLRTLREEQTGISESSKAAQVLSIWRQDPDFLGEDGRPITISPDGRTEPSLFSLLERANVDLDAKEILRQLERSRAVRYTPGGQLRLLSSYYIPSSQDPEYIKRFGLRLRDLAQTIYHNSIASDRDNPRRFEATAYTMRLDSRYLPRFRNIVAEQGVTFLRQIDEWLAGHEVKEDGTRLPEIAGVGVYLFEEGLTSR